MKIRTNILVQQTLQSRCRIRLIVLSLILTVYLRRQPQSTQHNYSCIAEVLKVLKKEKRIKEVFGIEKFEVLSLRV
jgi:hypothetical protein